MASSKEYLEYILDRLSGLPEISCRPMMGEYILYYRQKIFGGIFDDRLLVKPVPAALAYLSSQEYEIPYEGGKPMLLVNEVDDKAYLTGLIRAMEPELVLRKVKPKKAPC